MTIPQTTLTNATASSKQGQSSAGAGCTNTSNRVAGTTVADTLQLSASVSCSMKGSASMCAHQIRIPRREPTETSVRECMPQ